MPPSTTFRPSCRLTDLTNDPAPVTRPYITRTRDGIPIDDNFRDDERKVWADKEFEIRCVGV